MIAYCDGIHTLLDIAEIIKAPMWELLPIYAKLAKCGLLRDLDSTDGALKKDCLRAL
jgi:aminopeptidase-like protein